MDAHLIVNQEEPDRYWYEPPIKLKRKYMFQVFKNLLGFIVLGIIAIFDTVFKRKQK